MRKIYILLTLLICFQLARAGEFTYNSVLASGDWYKISIRASGIYQITYQDLKDWGLEPAGIDPRNIRLYGNGGAMLNESTSQPRVDDLIENAVRVIGEEDGKFDEGDYILFYASGPMQWSYSYFYQKFEHTNNLYSDESFYFLTVGDSPGKRIITEAVSSSDADYVVNHTNDFVAHEVDSVNLIKSGKEWYGEVFKSVTSYDFNFSFPNIDTTQPAYFKANFVARSTESSSTFSVFYDGEFLGDQEIGSVSTNSVYARSMTTRIMEFMPKSNVLKFTIDYNKPDNASVGWLNYIQVNLTSHLRFDGGQSGFRDVNSVGEGNTVQFNIETAENSIQVWDVTIPTNTQAEEIFPVQGGYAIKVSADSLREFMVFDDSDLMRAEFVEKVVNQNLHGLSPANLVIIAHPDFMEQAIRLADFHRQYSHLSVNIVTPQQVYNEFSSGAQDVGAIRDFMKMLYDRYTDDNKLRYLLLIGDASYDYKDRVGINDNYVPTFQAKESLKPTSSFVTDDFFGCLDYGEGSNATGTVDIGIGRFPVRTAEEASIIVDKIIHYSTASAQVTGSWRNSVCLVADDENNNIHLNQAEDMADIIDTTAFEYNVDKIYLDSYLQQKTPVGDRYPDANKAIDKTVDKGALIINYTGHGGETGWAEERVLDIPMIQSWKNYDRLPVFMTATCEFSRFDDPALVSAGELVILNPDGGGVALFTTTRLAYSQSNASLNRRFYHAAFSRDSLSGEYPRLGDLMREAKTPSTSSIKNFVLLGDPAMMLAYPVQKVRTLQISNEYTGKSTDTLHALSYVTIRGQVEDIAGNRLSNFQGKVYPEVLDKPVLYRTRANDSDSKVTDYYIQNKVLYKGEISVKDGEFSFSFIVPKDISYQFGLGKISYYAVDTSSFLDAHGSTPVYIGGSDEFTTEDEQGPEIKLYINDTSFRNGDLTSLYPVLLARIYDESGINTVGNGIGHEISAIIDGYSQNPVILNDYYTPDPDSYQAGWVAYPLGRMSEGLHSITLKAWDIHNNSSESSINFEIDTLSPLLLKGVYNFPNPFWDGTTFVFKHNQPGSTFNVIIDIYSMDGRMVNSLKYTFNTENIDSEPFYWNGRNFSGQHLSSGVYVYVVRASSEGGKFATISQKLMILR